MILAASADTVLWAAGAVLFFSVGQGIYRVAWVAHRVRRTPDALQGRVASASWTGSVGLGTLGAWLSTFWAESVGTALVLWVLGGFAICIPIAVGGWRR